MKNRIILMGALICALVGAGSGRTPLQAAANLAGTSTATTGLPTITSIKIQDPDIVILVSVPTGVKQVTLESRTRLGAGTWVPRAVKSTDGSAQSLTFTFPRSQAEKLEVLRVRADSQTALPASFYNGTTNFNGQASTTAPTTTDKLGPVDSVAPGANGATTAPATDSRQVVESDIWKIDGNTLYFFNQYRGLQVVDLSQPDAPVVRGTLPLTAAGEEMYLLDAQHVALLAQNGCGYGQTDGSQVLIVDVSGTTPSVVATVPLPGYIQESRLVGTAMYVASQSYQVVTVPASDKSGPVQQWEYGSQVTSIDLAQPTTPVARTSLWYSGWGNVITATDQYLFVGVQAANNGNWWQSTIHVVDISDPGGAMKDLSTITPAGRVADKFKMNVMGDVFTVISDTTWTPGSTGQASSVLQTFSLADPAAPKPLGKLSVGHGQGLYATRFDGHLVYIVTYLRIDPLWVVDLTDPANPTVSGSLEVPGWSTYIQPLGDRLVAIGVDNSNSWKVAVSLFDVHDPAKPALLSKVPMGDNYSWSEANYDEKALTVLPDAGLILVPYQGWGTNGYASRVQLIDLGRTNLAARGVIDHQVEPRRANVHEARIISISGRELLTVNASDRDHPIVTSDTELSWPVNQVVLSGNFLVEAAAATPWNLQTNAVLRVVPTADANQVLARVELTNGLPVLGMTAQGNKLYVIQGANAGYWWPLPLANADGQNATNNTNAPTLYLSVYDVASLPAMPLIGSTVAATDPLGWTSNLKPLWPKPNVLVWSGGASYFLPLAAVDGVVGIGPLRPIWWGGGGSGHLFAFDVSDPTAPQFASETDLTSTNGWWGFSDAFTAGTLVYVSHQGSEFLSGVTLSNQPPAGPVVVKNPDGSLTTNTPPVGIWVTKYYLEVVDFADPTTPTLRKPVSVPGQLKGLARGGALLYTSGPHWDAGWNTDWTQYLDASAYDGVQASLVDSMKLPAYWPQPLTVMNDAVVLGRTDTTNSTLETWAVGDSGKFAPLSTTKLPNAAQNLAAYGNLLVVQFNLATDLYDGSAPAALVWLGTGTPAGCVWADLAHGDGSTTRGFWAPLGDYGVQAIPLKPKP